MKIIFQKIKPEAQIPAYAHQGDAGMDLLTTEDKVLAPGERFRFELGVRAVIPAGYYVSFRDKSGLGAKGIHVLCGVVDSGYRGEWMVVLINLSAAEYEFKKGDKIAQALLIPIASPEIREGEVSEHTARGTGGFGSTGK